VGVANTTLMPSHSFGTLADGRAVERFVLVSSAVELQVISYGAIITSLCATCRNGRLGDVVQGHREVAAYSLSPHYLRAGQRATNR
jgi:galactose mutarotase-like enzyme